MKDATTRDIVYHQDYVKVGDDYELALPSGEDFFDTDLYIAVYSSDDISDPTNLLQEIQFNFECRTTETPYVDLKNQFGSSQLVSFTNDKQGAVDTMVAVSFLLELDVDTGMDESYLLETLKVETNFGDLKELSMAVAAEQLKTE